ncbi:cytochrome P450 family protein [Streptomyces monomycini]|uniref:cytochrome P450 family protein n=1 Tax=Streptomyces monomycini TaxID=371720 RepID=UPI000997FAFF|nr:cytochrome P450 [Streptomyces monomycini]
MTPSPTESKAATPSDSTASPSTASAPAATPSATASSPATSDGTTLPSYVGLHPGEPNLMEPELLDNPYTAYGTLREQAPLVRARFIDDSPIWLVTRFDVVREVMRDQRFVNNPTLVPGFAGQDPRAKLIELFGIPEHLAPYLADTILTSDPPVHTRLRRLVSRAFTARRIQDLRPRVERITDELLEQLPGHAEDGVVDLVEHFAYPLPITVICELVGIDEGDRTLWRRFGADLASLNPKRIGATMPEMIAHIHEVIDERRTALRDDLLSGLVRAQDDDGGRLSDVEMVTLVLTLVLAGHETTAHLISNGTLALLTHPDQRRLLDEDPALLPRAVHELMRWCGPIQATQLRYATEDTEVAGVQVRRGDALMFSLVAANHDPRHYDGPERLDLTRQPAGRAEDHVGFGHGMHYCLGASLARQEAEVAYGKLLARYPDLALALTPEQLEEQERLRQPGTWRLRRLPLRLGAES